MFRWLGKAWRGFVEFNRETLFGGVMKMTPEEHQEAFNQTFDSAKRLSDFIGMIVRLSFLTFALFFFLRRVGETDGIQSMAHSVCLVFAFGLNIAFLQKVFRVILLYEARDIPRIPAGSQRWVLLLLAVVITGTIYYGVGSLVGALSSDALEANPPA